MYESYLVVQSLHEDRVRDAMKYASSNRRVYDISEQMPNVYYDGLLHRIKQMISVRKVQKQEATDVRRAHAHS
jgi:hypothetical protein